MYIDTRHDGGSRIQKTWERYYATLRELPERLKQPVPFVVDAISSFKRHNIIRVLDLGCGAGRHCIYLGKNGFDVSGVDVSNTALEMAKKWVQKEKLKNVALVRGAMDDIPFGDQHFDAVIGVSVIHHALKRDIVHTVDEIHRVLRKKGLFIANLASVEDHRYGEGPEVEVGTFRILEHFEEKYFEELHHFFTKQEVSELLTRFAKIEVETHVAGKDKHHRYWKITALK